MAVIEQQVTPCDVGELYGLLAPRLERIVRLDVRAPDTVIEDACQFAWSRLVHRAGAVRRDAALSWLARTAVHEAWRLVRRDAREPASEELVLHSPGPDLQQLVEQRERLASVGQLPARQQRVLWLGALGLSYEEIAVHEDCTRRTVERQLLRARRALREQ